MYSNESFRLYEDQFTYGTHVWSMCGVIIKATNSTYVFKDRVVQRNRKSCLHYVLNLPGLVPVSIAGEAIESVIASVETIQ